MRLIFLPGFGEDPTIFNRIKPHIPGKKLFINWDLISKKPQKKLNADQYARQLITHFKITESDIIIGHSTGGWIAWFIKQHTGSRIVQIASWTDSKKVLLPIRNRKLIFWIVRLGLYTNHMIKRYSIRKFYQNKPSEDIYKQVFERLIALPREFKINQMRVILNPVDTSGFVPPDLRIHARKDVIVRPPKEDYVQVSGDHFTLWTHPEEVYRPIVGLLFTKKETS